MPYHLWMGNIVNIATDAIVNAANTELKRTPGICEAIFAAADSAKLEEAWPTSWTLSYRTFCDDAVLWAAGPLYYSRGRIWLVWRRGARAVTAGRLLPPRHDKGSDQRMQKHCVSTYFFWRISHPTRRSNLYCRPSDYGLYTPESCLGCGFGPLQAGNLSDGQTDFGMGRYTQLWKRAPNDSGARFPAGGSAPILSSDHDAIIHGLVVLRVIR